uniref:BHLH domain-containing protein n=1 Tax=Lepeophtheirus salmonis TaxID=72036 RepID=A0A0K2U4H7_LEPSM
MTNNVNKTVKSMKKNPLDVEAGKYRLWEKNRRDRFNAGLETLSASLPDYESGVSKWPKADIVERAINYIKALQAQRIPDDLQRRIKGLKRQNSKLREIIRSKLAKEMDQKEFSKLNLQEIQSLINKYEEAKANKENHPEKPAFLPTGDDHSYSLCSHDSSEPDLEVASEEVVEESSQEITQTTLSSSSPPTPTTTNTPLVNSLTLKPVTILSTPSGTLLNPTTWTVPHHSFIAIDPNPIISTVPYMMRPLMKLALPRLSSRVPYIKKSQKKVVENNAKKNNKICKGLEKMNTTSVQVETSQENVEEIIDLTPSEKSDDYMDECDKNDSSESLDLPSTHLDEFDLKASSTLPDAILASEDPEEIDKKEKTDGSSKKDEKEYVKTSGEIVDTKDKSEESSSSSPVTKPQEVIQIKKKSQAASGKSFDKSGGNGKSKSKSSYSIAALCQISVNIGGDPLVASETMVNSPGVVSLNSFGTASPSVTPAPSTPPAPTPPIDKKEADKVIQELKPVPPSVIKQAIDSKITGVCLAPPPPPPPLSDSCKVKSIMTPHNTIPKKEIPSSTCVKKNEINFKEVDSSKKSIAAPLPPTKDSRLIELQYTNHNKSIEKVQSYKKDPSMVQEVKCSSTVGSSTHITENSQNNSGSNTTASNTKQWTQESQIHSSTHYQHALQSSTVTHIFPPPAPKTNPCNNNPSLALKESGSQNIGKNSHYNKVVSTSLTGAVQSQQSHSHHQQQRQQSQVIHHQQQYIQGYTTTTTNNNNQAPIQNSLLQQPQQQIHEHQEFHYGNNTTILNEFLGHPLQTALPSSTPSASSAALQFHQGTGNSGSSSNEALHRYNYSSITPSNPYQAHHHHHHQSTTAITPAANNPGTDYHHHNHHSTSGQGNSSTNGSSSANNQVHTANHQRQLNEQLQSSQNDQYFPYNRSYYTSTQNQYDLHASSSTSKQQHPQQQKVSQQLVQQQQQQLLQQHQQQLQAVASLQMNSTAMMQPNTFSVNQLVSNASSSSSKSQRKGSKRASTSSSYEVSNKKSTRNPGVASTNVSQSSSADKDSSSRPKEDKKLLKVGPSSSRSSSTLSLKVPSSSLPRKGNYSAESLIMDPSQYTHNIAALEYQQMQQHQHQTNKTKMDFSSGWTTTPPSTTPSMMFPSIECTTSAATQFCSMSPSPFPQDLEFSMFISGNDASSYVSPSVAAKNNFKASASVVASGHNKMNNNSQHHQNLLFDNSNIFPLPNLTPPTAVEDPYASFMNSSSHHHHGAYNASSTTSNQKQSYNKHFGSVGNSGRFHSDYSTALNTTNSSTSSTSNNNNSNQVAASSSSLVNFNLSTIFPEINDKFASSALVPPLTIPPPPIPPSTSTSTSHSSSSQTLSSSSSSTKAASTIIPSVSSTNFRQAPASTSELLPHSIAMLGHGNSGQTASMAFSGGGNISGLNFQHPNQQTSSHQ